MNDAVMRMRGGSLSVHIKGLDEVNVASDNIMLLSSNTSFQVHLQAGPEEFVRLYNMAQAVTAPVLAAAVNSPVWLGNRLWQETRIALFQHSADERSRPQVARQFPTRVGFGDGWLRGSVLELFREDIARFRVIVTSEADEDPAGVLARGGVPRLKALTLHNGTVWWWNRPCYGVYEGRAHLRIENRVLPAGPTALDEVANAASAACRSSRRASSSASSRPKIFSTPRPDSSRSASRESPETRREVYLIDPSGSDVRKQTPPAHR